MRLLRICQGLGLGLVAVMLVSMGASSVSATALPLTDAGVLMISNSGAVPLGISMAGTTVCFNWTGGVCSAHTVGTVVSGISNIFQTAPSAADQITGFASTGLPVSKFETVAGAGTLLGQTISFDLESLLTPSGFATCTSSTAAGTACNPSGTPFVLLQNAAGGMSISFTVDLDAYTGTTAAGFTAYQGVFTSQLAGTFQGTSPCASEGATVANFLSCQAAGGVIDMNWSATEAPDQGPTGSTPEPASLLLLGSGLLGLAGYIRRK